MRLTQGLIVRRTVSGLPSLKIPASEYKRVLWRAAERAAYVKLMCACIRPQLMQVAQVFFARAGAQEGPDRRPSHPCVKCRLEERIDALIDSCDESAESAVHEKSYGYI